MRLSDCRPLAVAALGAALALGGCGYSLSPSPYGTLEPLSVSVPMATNKSRYSELGPMLTADIIRRLDGAANVRVLEGSPARLKLDIAAVSITGGSWDVEDDRDRPRNSASRVIDMTVEAVLSRPGADGRPQVRRQRFSSQRTFLVSEEQAQVEMRQAEAFQWLTNDLSQKIGQMMFSEF